MTPRPAPAGASRPPPSRPRGRRPGASTARDDIVRAARDLFAEKGFERTTIRAIGRRAGVDPALIHHYFGTKDDLFAEVIELPVDPGAVLAGLPLDPDELGRELVRRVLAVWEEPDTQSALLGLLRGATTHPSAARALREALARTLFRALGDVAVPDESASLRIALVAAQVAGIAVGRYVVRVPALVDASVDQIAALVGPVLGYYLRGGAGPS